MTCVTQNILYNIYYLVNMFIWYPVRLTIHYILLITPAFFAPQIYFFCLLIIILYPCFSPQFVSLSLFFQSQQPWFVFPLPSLCLFVLPCLSFTLFNSYLFFILHLYIFQHPSINNFYPCFLSTLCSPLPFFLCVYYFRLSSEVKWFKDV